MKISGRSLLPAAALALIPLMLLQPLPVLAAPPAKGPSASPAPSAPATSPSFTPSYEILGKLDGARVVQSSLPNSVPLDQGMQYAATYYTPKEIQSAYNMTGLISQGYGGKGETIAIIDAYGDPTIYQDVASFDKQFGLPPVNLSVIPVGPYQPSNGITFGWNAEVALDVEAAHLAAPYAHINLLVAANASNALYEAVKMAVDQRLGNVVTMSWGLGENSFGESGFSVAGFLNYAYLDYYFQKGAAEGISFFASSGDNGAFDGTTTVTADFPATSPFVTGVGGTTLYLSPTSGSPLSPNTTATYQGEAAWSVSPQYVGAQGVSSGGGYSTIFARPYYQAAAVSSAARATPDVAAVANPYTGLVIVLEGADYAIGGTSLASPLWAGMTADMNQYVGRSLGLLNPYLYSIYSDKAEYATAFNQITFGYNGAYQSGPGYNLVTGLGSPNLPTLAADIKAQAQGIQITVSTTTGTSKSAPAQYVYGESFTISAAATAPGGAPVTSGEFTADLMAPSGLVASVPLSFNGNTWTGSYSVKSSDPPGSWTVQVYGTSGTATGYGIADVSVGDSLGIEIPVPYPFASAVQVGSPFTITAIGSLPNGTAIAAGSLDAQLLYGGALVQNVNLTSDGGGTYSGTTTLSATQPQGSYSLVVESPGVGSVSTYLYVGEEVTGVMLTPLDTAIPSAAPGQRVVLLASTQTAGGTGVYTSNVTAKIYSLSGALMASVDLQPAPNTVQYGVFNFFKYNQANYTIPSSFSQGFYQVQFISSYEANQTSGVQLGNYTTGFYVSAPTLSYNVSAPAAVYEGQTVTVLAHVTNSTGGQVTSGVFFATAIPSGYTFESYVTDALGDTGTPMQYNSSIGAWEGTIQVPSPLTSFNSFVGNTPALAAGPWTVFVSGQSASAASVVPVESYVDVLPYIYYANDTLTSSNIASAPLVAASGGGYVLSGIRASTLTVTGVNITLAGVSIGDLIVNHATVTLVGSQVAEVKATGSKLSLLQGTDVGTLSLSSTTLTSSGSFYGSQASTSQGSDLVYAGVALAVVALVVAILAYRKKGRPASPPPVLPPQV